MGLAECCLSGTALRLTAANSAISNSRKPPDLTDVLPNNWLQSHPQHRWQIDDIRKKERQRSLSRTSASESDDEPHHVVHRTLTQQSDRYDDYAL